MLEAAGADHVITLDLHSKQAEGFFKIGVQNIDPVLLFSSYLKDLKDVIVVSPDIGGLIRARKLADTWSADLAIINKIRNSHNVCDMNTIIGEVSGRNCVIIDDIIDTAGTICKAATLLKQHGARSIKVVASHAVLSNGAKQRIIEAPIDSVLTTNSIPQDLSHDKFEVLSVIPLIAETITTLMRLQ
jgi:ribose-phosphate pyrophosphokinase